jgi:hypothetical protein
MRNSPFAPLDWGGRADEAHSALFSYLFILSVTWQPVNEKSDLG